MLADNLVPLTAAFAIVALPFLGGALMTRRRVRAAHDGLGRLNRAIEDRAAMMPIMLSTARADLAERGAAIEHGLWTAARFDKTVTDATTALADRRRGLDLLHARVIASRATVERLKSALRMIMRAIELRRTILG
ncbi:MAG: hypothetical protein ABIP53_09805 [Candidatus Limnocylindrales bacterium]